MARPTQCLQVTRGGRFPLLEVLDSRNLLIQVLLREQDAQQTFHIAVATLSKDLWVAHCP